MSHPLLECRAIDQPPREYLSSVGAVFAEFSAQTQDSGNISYGVQIGAERFFVKTAGLPDDSVPVLDHPARAALLRNAARLNASIHHPLLPALQNVIESAWGPLLVFPWLDGELLGVPRKQRDDPQSAFARFRALPPGKILACLDAVFDLHLHLADAGWVASDFYDGSLLYDFASEKLWVVDLDSYHDGPFRNDRGRMFGSTRFMAPEEFELGALLDHQTTVFVMGRTALVLLSDGTPAPEAFRGTPALLDVAHRACRPERAARFDSMADFVRAWQAARGV